MLNGLRPMIDLSDQERYEEAWWNATADNHDELDDVVLRELAAQDR